MQHHLVFRDFWIIYIKMFKTVFAEINAHLRSKRPSKTVIFQRGDYTKSMGFDGFEFF